MITLFFKKAIQDIVNNRFLNTVTVITIGLSVLIVSSFALLIINTDALLNSWKKGIRVLVYLKAEATEANRLDLNYMIQRIDGVQETQFISKENAMLFLKDKMKHQSSILENLQSNPLPDAFEIRIKPSSQEMKEIEAIAGEIEALPHVEQVEYGQHWIKRLTSITGVFKFVGYAMGSLFIIATLFIIANTIRLVLYSKKEEIEIMKLVGATHRFIKAPFYIEGLILGALGSIIGIVALFVAYRFVLANFQQSLFDGTFEAGFLAIDHSLGFVVGSMLVGWFGCYLSLKQFLRQ